MNFFSFDFNFDACFVFFDVAVCVFAAPCLLRFLRMWSCLFLSYVSSSHS